MNTSVEYIFVSWDIFGMTSRSFYLEPALPRTLVNALWIVANLRH